MTENPSVVSKVDVAKPLNDWARGQDFTAEHANEIIDAINTISIQAPAQEDRPTSVGAFGQSGLGNYIFGEPITRFQQPVAAKRVSITPWERGSQITAEKLNSIVEQVSLITDASITNGEVGSFDVILFAGQGAPPLPINSPKLPDQPRLTPWQSAEDLSASKLNECVSTLRNYSQGVNAPQQIIRPAIYV